MSAEPIPFTCPGCGAKYKVVKIEPFVEAKDVKVKCTQCSFALPPIDTHLKYFLVVKRSPTKKYFFTAKSKEPNVKLSARNQVKGTVLSVTKGATTSHVRIDIGQGTVLTSSITNEAVAELDIKKGDTAWAVVKASDVMIGK
jgi:molybdopterin-binding protein